MVVHSGTSSSGLAAKCFERTALKKTTLSVTARFYQHAKPHARAAPGGPPLVWTERVELVKFSRSGAPDYRPCLTPPRSTSQSADADPSGRKYCVPRTG